MEMSIVEATKSESIKQKGILLLQIIMRNGVLGDEGLMKEVKGDGRLDVVSFCDEVIILIICILTILRVTHSSSHWRYLLSSSDELVVMGMTLFWVMSFGSEFKWIEDRREEVDSWYRMNE